MKIHQRLYTVRPPRPLVPPTTVAASSSAPRVRSNSASRGLHTLPLSFLDGPPTPPSSRPSSTNLVVSSRLTVEVKAEIESHSTNSPYSHPSQNSSQSQSNPSGSGPPPYPLAFTSSQSDASPSHFHPYSSHNFFFPYPALGPLSTLDSVPQNLVDQSESSSSTIQRTRYHLDVGAYGIPKHSRDTRNAATSFATGAQNILSQDNRNSAVLVGEDAYFVRDNAMGVADGVGGWSKVNKNARVDGSSPSALFAQRLMSYCNEEVDAAMMTSSDPLTSSLERDLEDQLEDSLEDLSEGLDVLMILERAYDKTMRVHTATPSSNRPEDSPERKDKVGGAARSCEHSHSPVNTRSKGSSPTPSSSSSPPSLASDSSSALSSPGSKSTSSSSKSSANSRPQQSRSRNPLLQGSATALLAVLDHPPPPPTPPQPSLAHSRCATSSLLSPKARYPGQYNAAPMGNSNWYWAGKPDVRGSTQIGDSGRVREEVKDHGAVVRIAHLGDCMGMLIRGEEVVWRTEEMWWNFNTPVQLGPLSSTKPQDAKVFTVPVQADDILVLASDGLSDNLWDEDILDEVVRFKRSFMPPSSFPSSSTSSSTSSGSSTPSGKVREGLLGRKTLAGMLSEALCSRARAVSERRGGNPRNSSASVSSSAPASSSAMPITSLSGSGELDGVKAETSEEDEVPFARRAREQGRAFRGGKLDDISVLIAVVSPVETSKITTS